MTKPKKRKKKNTNQVVLIARCSILNVMPFKGPRSKPDPITNHISEPDCHKQVSKVQYERDML